MGRDVKRKKTILESKTLNALVAIVWFAISLWFLLKNVSAGNLVFSRYLNREFGFWRYTLIGGALQGGAICLMIWGLVAPLYMISFFIKWFKIIPTIIGSIPSLYCCYRWSAYLIKDFISLPWWEMLIVIIPGLIIWVIGLVMFASFAFPASGGFGSELDNIKHCEIFRLGATILGALICAVVGFIVATFVYYVEQIVVAIFITLLVIAACAAVPSATYYMIVKIKEI